MTSIQSRQYQVRHDTVLYPLMDVCANAMSRQQNNAQSPKLWFERGFVHLELEDPISSPTSHILVEICPLRILSTLGHHQTTKATKLPETSFCIHRVFPPAARELGQ